MKWNVGGSSTTKSMTSSLLEWYPRERMSKEPILLNRVLRLFTSTEDLLVSFFVNLVLCMLSVVYARNRNMSNLQYHSRFLLTSPVLRYLSLHVIHIHFLLLWHCRAILINWLIGSSVMPEILPVDTALKSALLLSLQSSAVLLGLRQPYGSTFPPVFEWRAHALIPRRIT